MAAKKISPTLKVLVEIRDELRSTSGRLEGRIDGLTGRIDALNGRVDALAQETREANMRVTTELVAVSGAVLSVRDLLEQKVG